MADRFAEKTLRVGGKTIRLTLPESAPETIIYLHGGEEESPAIAAVAAAGEAIAVIADVDWDAELSPWPAPRAFARGEDFSGRAGEYLRTLTSEIMPAVEAELQSEAPADRLFDPVTVRESLRGIMGFQTETVPPDDVFECCEPLSLPGAVCVCPAKSL